MKRKLTFIVLLALCAGILYGCGAGKGNPPAPTVTAEPSPEITPEPTRIPPEPSPTPAPTETPASPVPPHSISIYGTDFSSDAAELDLSGIIIEDGAAALEARLPEFTQLEKIVMSDCGLTDEEMDALNRKYPAIRFVWTVHFAGYSLRTDATGFIAAKEPHGELTNKNVKPLRYCTDLVALDLGHMKFTEISFVSEMKHLRFLVLADGALEDISPVAELPELEYLEIFRTDVTDLTPLLECPSLRDLNICYIPKSASQDALEVLLQTTWLERLFYVGNKLTREQRNQLRDAYPETAELVLYDEMESTGLDWRYHPRYYEMRDILGMYYMPGGTRAGG